MTEGETFSGMKIPLEMFLKKKGIKPMSTATPTNVRYIIYSPKMGVMIHWQDSYPLWSKDNPSRTDAATHTKSEAEIILKALSKDMETRMIEVVPDLPNFWISKKALSDRLLPTW